MKKMLYKIQRVKKNSCKSQVVSSILTYLKLEVSEKGNYNTK